MFHKIKTHRSFVVAFVLVHTILSAFTKLKHIKLLSHVTFLTTKFSRFTVHISHCKAVLISLYITNHSRWKSFVVANLNCNLLETIAVGR